MAPLDLVDDWPAPHAAVAVVQPGEVVATRGETDRRFPWASVTKLATACAVLVAIEEEVVALDDRAGPPGATVRHLLAHASGLAPDGSEVLARPGERRIYSNAGFETLSEVVAGAAGMPFSRYLTEAVLEPVGLRGASLDGSPAAGLSGTLDDLEALASELLVPRVLAGETVRAATEVAFPGLSGVLPGFGRQQPNDWGLGFEVRDGKSPHWTGSGNSPATFGHFGRTGTFLWVDPDNGLALCCLTDLDFGPWAADAWPRLADAVLDEWATPGGPRR